MSWWAVLLLVLAGVAIAVYVVATLAWLLGLALWWRHK